jgi:hypothetical protein
MGEKLLVQKNLAFDFLRRENVFSVLTRSETFCAKFQLPKPDFRFQENNQKLPFSNKWKAVRNKFDLNNISHTCQRIVHNL